MSQSRKAKNEQQEEQTKTHGYKQQCAGYQKKRVWEVEKGKGSQIW